MRILYGVQGTGNGHISRAVDIVPALKMHGEVDILISGFQAELDLPFEVTYRRTGMSFVFGKRGGINFWQTWKRNKIRQFIKDIRSLNVRQYDLVITDFEPLTAWACRLAGKGCIGLSNQYAVLSASAPQARSNDRVGKFFLNHYAPVTTGYGFHFQRYDKRIYTPIVRKQVRELSVTDEGHYTVYVPAYSDKRLIKHLSKLKHVSWQVFSKHEKRSYTVGNVSVQPIDNDAFLKSLASSAGVLCAAGFATPSEALFLGKKLMVIPQKNQIEQQCNAVALKGMGVATMKSLKKKRIKRLCKWVSSKQVVQVDYPDITQELVGRIVRTQTASEMDWYQEAERPTAFGLA